MTATAPRLSVVAIACNEERDLPGFLDNFCAWADEVVIVDDGSTDRTLEIAAAAGPRVHVISSPRQKGEGFSDQRNKGIAAATGDWMLHVDVDMRASCEMVEEICSAIRLSQHDAYRFRLRHCILNRYVRFGGAQGWNKPWLVRRGCGRFSGIVHEKMELIVSNDRVGELDSRMLHLGDESFGERLLKNVRYSQLEAERAAAAGRRTSLLGAFGAGALATFRTYLLQLGILDGRVGLFWALYVFSGTINRHLLMYDMQTGSGRAMLESEIRLAMHRRTHGAGSS